VFDALDVLIVPAGGVSTPPISLAERPQNLSKKGNRDVVETQTSAVTEVIVSTTPMQLLLAKAASSVAKEVRKPKASNAVGIPIFPGGGDGALASSPPITFEQRIQTLSEKVNRPMVVETPMVVATITRKSRQ